MNPIAGLAIAVGARANSPTPAIPAAVQTEIDAAVDNHKGITVIVADGQPSIACVMTFRSDAKNPAAKKDDLRRFREQAAAVVHAVRAQKPEADPLAALSRAAAAAGDNGTVVLIDSGLQTVPPLDFVEPGLLTADTDEVADELANRGYLPDLRGRKVILAGIGYTADPQRTLDENQRTHLVQMWQRIVTKAGAVQVQMVPEPNTAGAATTAPKVSLVTVPAADSLHLGCNTALVLADDGAVGFVPDTTTFMNDGAAGQVLGEIAGWLQHNPQASASLLGTVAHYGQDDGDAGLPRARAERVRDELVRLGASSSKVTAHGGGWGPFPTKKAPPSVSIDQLNRRVVVTITCH